MAKTAVATGNALTKKHYEEKLFRDTIKESYFGSKFFGTGPENLVQVKTQVEKDQGDKVTFGIRMRLAGAGVNSGTILEGNEESLVTYDSSVTLEEYAHAVRDKGPLDRKRPSWDMDAESRMAIQDWGTEKIDSLCFTALNSSPTKILYPDGTAGAFTGGTVEATVKAALSAANSKITMDLIAACKTWAMTGGDRAYTPIRPIKIGGKNYYVLLVHPDVLYDLEANSSFQQAQREAEMRGKENPLFSGAEAIYRGVVIHAHENVTTAADGGGASVRYSRNVLLGQQALVWAWGKRPEVTARDFDYGREHGYAWSMISAVDKPTFNSLDYGSVHVWTACSDISGQ